VEPKRLTTNVAAPFWGVKQLFLALAMLAAVLLVFWPMGNTNPYASAYNARIKLYKEKLDSLTKIRDYTERMFMKHVANVKAPEYISQRLQPGDTVLLPPIEYGNKYQVTEAIWTDPRVFTYMAGFRPIVPYDNVAKRNSANVFVFLDGRRIWLGRRGGAYNIDSLLEEYSQLRKKRAPRMSGSR
jgi:hypothetical protein